MGENRRELSAPRVIQLHGCLRQPYKSLESVHNSERWLGHWLPPVSLQGLDLEVRPCIEQTAILQAQREMPGEVVVDPCSPQDGGLGLGLRSRDGRAGVDGIKLQDDGAHQRERLQAAAAPG